MSDIASNFLLVFAGSYQQYNDFILKHRLSPRKAIYIKDTESLHGLRQADYVLVGDYWATPLWENRAAEITARLKHDKMREIKWIQ